MHSLVLILIYSIYFVLCWCYGIQVMVQNIYPSVCSTVFLLQLMLILINKTYYQQFRFVDFNVIFSYLLLVMFFFHLSHSIHAQLSTVFTETYLNITYIISHLRSTSLGRRKWFYVFFTVVLICSTLSHSSYSAYLVLLVNLRIQSECSKIQTKKTSLFGRF